MLRLLNTAFYLPAFTHKLAGVMACLVVCTGADSGMDMKTIRKSSFNYQLYCTVCAFFSIKYIPFLTQNTTPVLEYNRLMLTQCNTWLKRLSRCLTNVARWNPLTVEEGESWATRWAAGCLRQRSSSGRACPRLGCGANAHATSDYCSTHNSQYIHECSSSASRLLLLILRCILSIQVCHGTSVVRTTQNSSYCVFIIEEFRFRVGEDKFNKVIICCKPLCL